MNEKEECLTCKYFVRYNSEEPLVGGMCTWLEIDRDGYSPHFWCMMWKAKSGIRNTIRHRIPPGI